MEGLSHVKQYTIRLLYLYCSQLPLISVHGMFWEANHVQSMQLAIEINCPGRPLPGLYVWNVNVPNNLRVCGTKIVCVVASDMYPDRNGTIYKHKYRFVFIDRCIRFTQDHSTMFLIQEHLWKTLDKFRPQYIDGINLMSEANLKLEHQISIVQAIQLTLSCHILSVGG